MEIEYNSRQIPSNKIYTADKGYYDLLYGYLQSISVWDRVMNVRYILKKDVNFVKFANFFNVTRQTIAKKFNHLIDRELVIYDEEHKRYILPVLDPQTAALLPNDTVRILCNTLKERVLSILSYLLKTYIQHGEKPCQITIDVIKDYIGLNVGNRGFNNQIVLDCLLILERIGFIRYHKEFKKNKFIYILDYVNTKVEFKQK